MWSVIIVSFALIDLKRSNFDWFWILFEAPEGVLSDHFLLLFFLIHLRKFNCSGSDRAPWCHYCPLCQETPLLIHKPVSYHQLVGFFRAFGLIDQLYVITFWWWVTGPAAEHFIHTNSPMNVTAEDAVKMTVGVVRNGEVVTLHLLAKRFHILASVDVGCRGDGREVATMLSAF